ncbi:MAG: type II toxin-antitoxin system VapC family toxin [Acidobacteria bacterium]|nr:type II toxin-antitoxin system VapC family toxin [Acidobacteriota bacterium]
MTLRYLLDTSIVSNPVSRTPDPQLLERLDVDGPECAIAAPVWHELTFGCRRLPRGQRRVALEAYVEQVVRGSFPILPYDDVAAAWHGHERARLEALGKPAPYVDGQIAAVAQVNRLVLVTANTKNFARFKGLNIENWIR